MVSKDIKVYYLSILENVPKRWFWDYTLVDDTLAEFDSEEVDSLPSADIAIVV